MPGSPYPYENLRPGEVEAGKQSSGFPLRAVFGVVELRLRGRSDENQVRENGSLRPRIHAGARGALCGRVHGASFAFPPWRLLEECGDLRVDESASGPL